MKLQLIKLCYIIVVVNRKEEEVWYMFFIVIPKEQFGIQAICDIDNTSLRTLQLYRKAFVKQKHKSYVGVNKLI